MLQSATLLTCLCHTRVAKLVPPIDHAPTKVFWHVARNVRLGVMALVRSGAVRVDEDLQNDTARRES